jgi:hypothetical protein
MPWEANVGCHRPALAQPHRGSTHTFLLRLPELVEAAGGAYAD